MNLIVCAQNCRHQCEGYCELNSITSLSGNNEAKCGYYQKAENAIGTDKNSTPEDLAKYTHGI
ncbi:MAG: hypothetical protein FWE32_12445 [Oscillospiraceae bacterium]|nr:hypothetical protein [Oscillospiraceae bacterium]